MAFALLYGILPLLATTVRFENRSGRRLERVELSFCNEDRQPWRPLRAAALEPGEVAEFRCYFPLPIIVLTDVSFVLEGRELHPHVRAVICRDGTVVAVEPGGELTGVSVWR